MINLFESIVYENEVACRLTLSDTLDLIVGLMPSKNAPEERIIFSCAINDSMSHKDTSPSIVTIERKNIELASNNNYVDVLSLYIALKNFGKFY